MRTGLSTIQQTLTPEAASVLNHSIAEAARRNHGQTTPLHVAATLLASPSGYLRQACIRSHPNSSHPLQCRALELCFSVALERLPSAQNQNQNHNLSSSSPSPSPPGGGGGLEPPISNALMAALKRAQAHQRRGCPEQQQQPLLAVKVELEQLIVSILDDPSVSRVMREASFSSPAVKSTIEQSLINNINSSTVKTSTIVGSGLGFRPSSPVVANRNLYLSPRLQQGNNNNSEQHRKDEVKKVVDVLMKNKKRNPVLVGDTEPEPVMRELLQKIEKKEVGEETTLRNVQVISLDKEIVSDRTQIPAKLKELGDLIETRISSISSISSSDGGGGVILNLGDLKWLVEQPATGFGGGGVQGSTPMQQQQQQQIVSETGKIAVEEMGKLLGRFGEGSRRLWMIGTATCETYLRCQVYHPKMENDWDLQAVPVAARTPPPGLFPRLGGNGILSRSVDSFTPLKGFPTTVSPLSRRPSENLDPSRSTTCCSQCMENYEKDVAKLVAAETEKSSSDTKPETARQPLPQWMQNAKPNNGNVKTTDHSQTMEQELILKQKTKELQKKWNDTCSRLHPSFHNSLNSQRIVPMMNLYKPNPLGRQLVQSKMQITKNLGGTLQLSQTSALNTSERPASPPGSPVRTELILGRQKLNETSPEETHRERIKDLTGCIPLDPQFTELQRDKHARTLDPDSFKSLFKGLIEKVWWQADAASAVATSVIHCRSGSNRRQGVGGGLKGDSWLLFAGPDRIGKKKMASALSEVVGRASPITIRLGSRSDENEESDVTFRGKTTVDRIAEAVRRNPFSIIVLEDIDCADMLVQGSIKRAMERGRLPDSHGREVSLGNVIFILTADWLPENSKNSSNCPPLNMEKLSNTARSGWHLQISVCQKTAKRRRTDTGPALTIDLNQEAEAEAEDDNAAEGSRDSSAVTVDNEHEQALVKKQVTVPQSTLDLFSSADDEIIFKPVDFDPIRVKITNTISSRFSAIVGGGKLIEVEDETLEQILGGVWFGQTGLEEWTDRVLVPIFHQLKNNLASYSTDENVSVKLTSVKGSERRSSLDWLPSKVTVDVQP